MLNIGGLINHIVLAPRKSRCERLDGVLAPWMHQHLDVTVRCANQPVGAVDLVFNSPRMLWTNHLVPILTNDAVVSFASSAGFAC